MKRRWQVASRGSQLCSAPSEKGSFVLYKNKYAYYPAELTDNVIGTIGQGMPISPHSTHIHDTQIAPMVETLLIALKLCIKSLLSAICQPEYLSPRKSASLKARIWYEFNQGRTVLGSNETLVNKSTSV